MKVIAWIIAIPLILLGFLILLRALACGPNKADVKVMKPMAEAISSHILKHGIPENLEDIPGLPYEVEGCETKVTYYKYDSKAFGNITVDKDHNPDYKVIREKCSFHKNMKSYYLTFNGSYNPTSNRSSVDIRIGNKESRTWDILIFHSDKNKKVISDKEISFMSSKTSGICNPMRQ